MTEPLSFTPEDKDHISSLLRSQGWKLILSTVIVPRLLHISNQIDQPGADLSQTQLWRGAKLEMRHLLQTLYVAANLPDPLKEHYQAFITSLNLPDPSSPESSPSDEIPSLFSRPKPPAYPVL